MYRHQPLGCYFEKNSDLSGSGIVCVSLGGCINLPELNAQLLFAYRFLWSARTLILTKHIFCRTILSWVIKTCINKGGVCTGKLVLLLLSPPLAFPSPIHCWCHCCSYKDLFLSDAVTCITKQWWSCIISEPSEVLTDVFESQRRCSMRAAEAKRD